MNYRNLHRWDVSPKEAIRIQSDVAGRIVLKPFRIKDIKHIAGVDVSVKGEMSKAAIVVLSYPAFEPVETLSFTMKTVFPYVPGLLSFREGPVILECVKRLKTEPDVLIFDGQGLAHPRKAGLASHLGVVIGKPSIGSAKSHLYGSYRTPGREKGDLSEIKDEKGKAIGAVLRTRDNTNPVFVSPGHLMDIASAVKIIISCCPKYKIPEPIRAAHRAASLVSN
jgi:deoxyribonuclease V